MLGRKLIFTVGFGIFTFASLLCGCSDSISQLIIFRGLQGLGAAMLMANGPAIITSAFPATERGKALGTLAMIVSAGLAIGPFLGGILVKTLSWPAIFFVNLPIGLAGIYLVQRYIPATIGVTGLEAFNLERENNLPWKVRLQIYGSKLRYFDWLGAILWMIVQLGYSLAIDQQNVLGLAGPLQRLISFSAAGLFILFLIWEWSIKDPVLDLTLFRSRTFFAANLSGFFNIIAISSVTLLMPFYFQNIRGLPPHKVGLMMTLIPLTIFFVAPISGRLSDRYGTRFLSTLGMAIICVALALLGAPWQGLLSLESPSVGIYLVCIGAGIGLFQSPNNNSLMGSVSKENLGVASALLATVRNFGLVTGVALSTTLLMHFYHQQTLLGAENASAVDSFIIAMRHTFLCLAALCSIGIITCTMKQS